MIKFDIKKMFDYLFLENDYQEKDYDLEYYDYLCHEATSFDLKDLDVAIERNDMLLHNKIMKFIKREREVKNG